MKISAAVRIRARSGLVEPREPVSSGVLGTLPTSRQAASSTADGVHLVSPAPDDPSRALGAADSDGASCRPAAAAKRHGFVFSTPQSRGEPCGDEVRHGATDPSHKPFLRWHSFTTVDPHARWRGTPWQDNLDFRSRIFSVMNLLSPRRGRTNFLAARGSTSDCQVPRVAKGDAPGSECRRGRGASGGTGGAAGVSVSAPRRRCTSPTQGRAAAGDSPAAEQTTA